MPTTPKPLVWTLSCLALCGLASACVPDAHCEETIRDPNADDLPEGVSTEEFVAQFLGEHTVEIHWYDVDQSVFESSPHSGTTTLTLDVREGEGGLYVIDREKVGDPSARLACTDSMVLATTLSVSSDDDLLSGTTAVEASVFNGSLSLRLDLEQTELLNQLEVEYFKPDAWDDTQVLMRLVLVDGSLSARVDVNVYAGNDRYGYLIGES